MKRRLLALTCAALAAWPALALAQARGAGLVAPDKGYFGVAGGFAFQDQPCQRYTDCDRTAAAGRAMLGVLVLRDELAVEALGLYLGRTRSREAGITADTTVALVGAGIATVLDYGGGIRGLARLGLGAVRSSVTQAQVTQSQWRPALYAGVSLSFQLTRAVSLDLHYDATTADYVTRDARADALTAGFSVRF
jgi:opacity protein-like surface antigen